VRFTLESGVSRRVSVAGAAILATVLAAALWMTSNAKAAELLYWDNYDNNTIANANIDGSGGGALNLSGITLKSPEGMAYDTLTNRLFVASSSGGAEEKGEIVFVNLDGSGAGVLSTAGAEVSAPYGVAIDPSTRLIYWVNESGGPEGKGSVAYARLDGSGGGLLNTSGAVVNKPYKLAIDRANGKVYWGNTEGSPDSIAFANLNNTGGGGTLSLAGAPVLAGVYAIAVDEGAGRVYWLDSTGGEEHLGFASVNGGGGGEVNLTGSVFDNAYGLAIDPTIGRAYWGNYGHSTEPLGAIGFANLSGGGSSINIATAPVNGPQDPVIVKSPSGAGAPKVTRSKKSRSKLSCSTGTWGEDFAGSFVYQAPRTFAYQWTRNGKSIAGAASATFKAKSPGKYACVVTASNQAGSAAQTSKTAKVKAAKLKLTAKKKAKAQAGGVATFKVKATNTGDLKSPSARVCVKAPTGAGGDLKTPKCKSLGKLASGGKRTAKLKIKVGPSADGAYKVTFLVRGAAGTPAKAKILVG
jgi:hypothetical protein